MIRLVPRNTTSHREKCDCFGCACRRLAFARDELGNAIINALLPVFLPMVKWLDRTIAK